MPVDGIAVRLRGGQKAVFATKLIPANTEIGYFEGFVVSKPNKYTITADGVYVQSTGEFAFINHHCAPNAFYKGRVLFAEKEILPGEEITIDYRRTEKNISSPFDCNCGAANCCKRVE